MVRIIKASDKHFPEFIENLNSATKAEMSKAVIFSVEEIAANVIKNGDDALISYTNKFDRTNYKHANELRVKSADIEKAYKDCDDETIAALKKAANRIELYHKKQMPSDIDYKDKEGVRLGNLWKSIEKVGIYVPGGLASYPSSVLMNAIPARVAGVKNIVMAVPAPEGKLNPVVLAAAKIAGVKEIYKIGGAQAIAALATGTKTVPSVDKIVGPGNAYVAAAKRHFYGTVGIDMIAGPSEILVVADNKNNPDWIAADLLSQAEHDADARSILITNEEKFANSVVESVEALLKKIDRREIAEKSWKNNGAVIIVKSFDESVDLINKIAPEHLELALDRKMAQKITDHVHNTGAVFIGRYTPEAIGDYTAGPSHVLPTAGTARFSSGLSVFDFLKRMSLIECTEKSFNKLVGATAKLADEEGLTAHALSITIRT